MCFYIQKSIFFYNKAQFSNKKNEPFSLAYNLKNETKKAITPRGYD